MAIPEFMNLLQQMTIIHQKKNEDYAAAHNPFENFEHSSQLMEWFNDPMDKAFVSLIGTKLARLATLSNTDKEPNNESIDDSFLDLCTYCALWASYRKRFKSGPQKTNQVLANYNTQQKENQTTPDRTICGICNKPLLRTDYVFNRPNASYHADCYNNSR